MAKAPPAALRAGWVAALVASATVVLAVVGGLDWTGAQARTAIPADTAVTRVGAGETVWDVAQRVAPRSDQGAVVQRIRQLNGIVGSAVVPGQQLHVPDGHVFPIDAVTNGYQVAEVHHDER
ncbi:MAG TPA: LysM peptidoglycan-binding domain-containing protein [Pseudonocardiaceae bacterium]|nr:LysM peptidoglycan-binding domain-containing protein [Pseudonocardiaceae bacterium]